MVVGNAPSLTHADRHAYGGPDALAPLAIGAAPLAPPPSGDITGAEDTGVIMEMLATKDPLRTRPGIYWVTIDVDSLESLEIVASTRLMIPAGANRPAIMTKNFQKFVPGFTTEDLLLGVAVTTLASRPLTWPVAIGDTIEIGDWGITTTATATAAVGDTSVSVAEFTPFELIPAGQGIKLNPSFAHGSGAPQGFQITGDGLIDGNAINQDFGCGVGIFGYRFRLSVWPYNTKDEGVFSSGANGSTEFYPYGQVETIIDKVVAAQCGGTGLHYEGPHDGYAKYVTARACGGNGVDASNLDGDYCHTYGNQIGFTVQGPVRWNHIEVENNQKEGLAALTSGKVVSSCQRLTAFDNWQNGQAQFGIDKSVDLTYRFDVMDADVLCSQGENGVYIQGNGQVFRGDVRQRQDASGEVGIDITANRVEVDVNTELFAIGMRRYGANSRIVLRGTNTNNLYYEPDTIGIGNKIIELNATTGPGQVPWVFAGGEPLAGNSYELIASGEVNQTLFQQASL